jgi:hypothetical protein
MQRRSLPVDGDADRNRSADIVTLRPAPRQTSPPPQQQPPQQPLAIAPVPPQIPDRVVDRTATGRESSQAVDSAKPVEPASGASAAATLPTANSVALRQPDAGRPGTGIHDGQPPPTESEERKAVHWQVRLQQALDGLERALASTDGDLTDIERQRLEVHSRLLQIVLGQHEPALKDIARMPLEQREYWKHQLRTMLLLLDENATPSQSRRVALAMRELQAATERLASQSSLDLRNLAFCSRVDGFGTLTEFSKTEFSPGQEILLYVEIDHFTSEADENGNEFGRRGGRRYETELRGSYQILNASGSRVADAELPVDKQSCRSPRRDYFIAYHIYLPKNLDAGAYSMQLTIEDVKSKRFGHGSLEFQIKAPAADSSR